jgi:hypothetical protein
MEFRAKTTSGQEVTIEVYYDDQAGLDPGWCWRGKSGEDAMYAGGDVIDDMIDADSPEEALQAAKSYWGVE